MDEEISLLHFLAIESKRFGIWVKTYLIDVAEESKALLFSVTPAMKILFSKVEGEDKGDGEVIF